MSVWPRLQDAIKVAIEEESARIKQALGKSLLVKNKEIKSLKDQMLKLEHANANMISKTQELERVICEQDVIIQKRNKEIEELNLKLEVEKIRLTDHVYRRKLKIKELKSEKDDLVESNRKLEMVVKKQEAKVNSLQSKLNSDYQDVSIPIDRKKRFSGENNSRAINGKSIKQSSNGSDSTSDPIETDKSRVSSSDIADSKISDESFFERIRSKTMDGTENQRKDMPDLLSDLPDSSSKRKRRTNTNSRVTRKRNV